MDSKQSQEQRLLEAALALEKPSEREAFLAAIDDPALRQRLAELVAASTEADSFFRQSPVENAGADSPGVAPPVQADLQESPCPMIGRYKLLEKIGEGGFGDVWMAEQREPVKRRVALKIIKLGMDSRQVVARFEAERQALAMMDHPNIAKIFDADVTDTGRPYFVMELVRGIRITEYCDQNQLPTQERLKLFVLVCQAIQHAHQKGIIHRDIKPSNILVTLHDGVPVPKVIDFGIAKATQQELTDKTVFTQFQQFIGTPAYISPEQAEMSGLDIDTRADIYSLGVLLYELLVGQTPFDAKEMMQGGLDALRQIIREKEPLRPSTKLNTLQGEARTKAGKHRQADVNSLVHQLQGDLDWIVMKCLEKDRTRRYDTANALAGDLQRHLNNEPIAARAPSRFYRFQKAVLRNKLAFGSATAVALALLIGLVVSVEIGLKARREAAKSQRVAQFLKDMVDGISALGRDTALMCKVADHTAGNVRTRLLDEPEVAMELELVLARVYSDLLEFDRMADSAKKVRRLASGSIGKETFAYADATSFLARALLGSAKLEEAEATAREAIAFQRRMRGPGSTEEAQSLRCLGDSLRGLNRLPEAEAVLVQSATIFRQRLGNDTSEVAWTLNSLNIVLELEGKLAEAEDVIREAIVIRTKLPEGREQVPLGWHYERLAATLMSHGATSRLPEAEEALRKAIEVECRLAGDRYPALAWPHIRMARLLERQARLSEAEVHYRTAAEVARDTQALSKDQRASFILGLGQFLERVGKQQESSAVISESQSISPTPRP